MWYKNETEEVVVLEIEDAATEIGPGAEVWVPEESPYGVSPELSKLTEIDEPA